VKRCRATVAVDTIVDLRDEHLTANGASRRVTRSALSRLCIVLALAAAGCASMPAQAPLDGMPLDAFLDDLKAQLREVHWHVRGAGLGCDGTGPREVDLRDGTIAVDMQRIAQVDTGASVKLVAIPLGGIAVVPSLAADATRKEKQSLSFKLAVEGPAEVVDFERAPPARSPVARTINAAIDGFMRAGADKPCIRLATLELALVVDVARDASGSLRVVVPAVGLEAGASDRRVNTLTLAWTKIESRALR
jgi:hypothetical protein